MNYRKMFLGVALTCVSCFAFATELGGIAKGLVAGGDILKKLLWAACIVVGILLIATAFTQFQIHRRNPKLVPLTTPVMYIVLGIVSIAIPFVDTVEFMLPKNKQVQSSQDDTQPPPSGAQQYYNPNDIDAPIYR